MKWSSETKEWVQRRARFACEYCRLPQSASILFHQIDHIIGKQHRGSDLPDNLCLCCIRCNLKKGPNIASVDPETLVIVPRYHPRQQSWGDHFVLRPDAIVDGRTAIGRATLELLEMNDPYRIRLRAILVRKGWAPD